MLSVNITQNKVAVRDSNTQVTHMAMSSTVIYDAIIVINRDKIVI